jgi:hypothetical protein
MCQWPRLIYREEGEREDIRRPDGLFHTPNAAYRVRAPMSDVPATERCARQINCQKRVREDMSQMNTDVI